MVGVLSVLSTSAVPGIGSSKPDPYEIRVRVLTQRNIASFSLRLETYYGGIRSTRLNAELTEIEPDLNEDPVDRWRTNSVPPEEYQYGIYDGHHTYHEGEDRGTFWGSIAEDYAAVDPPKGFLGFISWIFLPAVAAGMYFNIPGDYLFIGAALFTIIYTIFDLDQPSEAHNFEPQIYNMERGARDKLIADYNTMDIWDFNEKYGDLWDFTVTMEEIKKR